ncbi:major facilitator superfamily transporter [Colletotrichum tofieldiae]|uniref:Major facilitator superfamily transporter n=1 Tax=Colletotrichum tofieldiae TaxID=708197 RepID=A0A166V4Y2_9PEZI|nr:major facilitator superfamily transporter [Colletotrichum tofieldiae]
MEASKNKKITPTSQPDGSTRDGSMEADSVKSNVYDDDVVQVLDKAAEQELCRKLGFRILTVLAIMVITTESLNLFNALDKGSLGNAETDGQYHLIASIFCALFVAAAPFVALIGKKFGPVVLPIPMFTFGTITMLMAAVQSAWGGVLFPLRWFLDMARALPGHLLHYLKHTPGVLLTSSGVPLANLMDLVSSNIFRKPDAPKYAPALIPTVAFGVAVTSLALTMGLYLVGDKKTRNRTQGVILTASGVPTSKLGDGPKRPNFRWFL